MIHLETMFTNVTLIFFLLLIPLAGFIAWAGDRIGHKTGKRRQSLLGLRPRHTAMVFTIGSGMAIALVSFGLFYALSETFRMVIRDGAQMYQHNRELKAENAKQAELLRVSRRTAVTAQAETEKYNRDRQAAENSLTTAQNELQQVEAQKRDAEGRAKTAQDNYAQAAKGRKKAQDDLSLAQTELVEVQRSLKDKTKSVQDTERLLTAAHRKVKVAETSASVAEKQYNTATTERDKARKQAKAAIAETQRITGNALRILREQSEDLNGQIAKVQERLDKQKKDFDEQQTKTDSQRLELANLTRELEERQKEYDQVVAKTDTLRKRQITFQVGEEVERISLRSGYNLWRLQGMLRAFLGNAAKRAERRGAARGGEDRAVVIAPQAVTLDGNPVLVGGKGEEDDAIRVAAEAIRKINQEVVVLAISRVNAVAGEPVAVDLKLFRNPVVLKEGTKISEGVISSDGTRQETMRSLAVYMSKEVHAKLVAAGMLPVSRSAESETNASEAGQMSGEFTLNNEDWEKLIQDVRRAGTAARVQVYAAKDMRAGDSLALRFSVHEQPSDQAINKP